MTGETTVQMIARNVWVQLGFWLAVILAPLVVAGGTWIGVRAITGLQESNKALENSINGLRTEMGTDRISAATLATRVDALDERSVLNWKRQNDIDQRQTDLIDRLDARLDGIGGGRE